MAEQKTDVDNLVDGSRSGGIPGKGGRKPRVKAEIITAMARRILSGDIKPGQYLPIEPVLCEEYGVSRTVIREVTKVLESKGLLSIRSRVGTQVLEQESWNLLDPDIIVWSEDLSGQPAYIASLMEMRRIVEPTAAALAAKRATGRDIEALENAAQTMAKMHGVDNEQYARADADFHFAILVATKNHGLIQLGRIIYAASVVLFRTTAVAGSQPEHSMALHWEIAAAIKAGDAERARKASETIVEGSMRDLEI